MCVTMCISCLHSAIKSSPFCFASFIQKIHVINNPFHFICAYLQIFNRFLSGLHLPVGKSKPSYSSSFELLAVGTTARWIVYMINEGNGCLDHLGTLFKALESFYHPSNYGRHSVCIGRIR